MNNKTQLNHHTHTTPPYPPTDHFKLRPVRQRPITRQQLINILSPHLPQVQVRSTPTPRQFLPIIRRQLAPPHNPFLLKISRRRAHKRAHPVLTNPLLVSILPEIPGGPVRLPSIVNSPLGRLRRLRRAVLTLGRARVALGSGQAFQPLLLHPGGVAAVIRPNLICAGLV